MNVLETTSLAKRFGRIAAVRGLTLAVPPGSIYGILGPNGSGKTTTLGMVLGVVHPDEGQVTWFGQAGSDEARRRIGALLETPALYPSLSAEKNLAVVASIKRRGMNRIASVLDQVGLYDRRTSPVQTYSLGMRQRLALAVVLLAEPEVMVLDEPTNGLDPQGIADVRTLIQTINGRGTTVIMASHVLDEVERVCTHVAVLKQGQLLADGPIAAVLQAKNRMLIGAANMTALREALPGIAGITAVTPHGELLEITVDELVTAESLNKQLFERGIVLTHLQGRSKGLEDAFLALVGDDVPPA
jgi:ABC-2 type transport system ATP-binding protein